MEIAKPGVPYASIAASTRASRPGGGAAKALVESSSAAAKAANRVSFGLADIMASWIGSLGAVLSSAAQNPGRGIRRDLSPRPKRQPRSAAPGSDFLRPTAQQPPAPGHPRHHNTRPEHPRKLSVALCDQAQPAHPPHRIHPPPP